MMRLMGIDIGTTHCKVGLFEKNGDIVKILSCPTRTHHTKEGCYYDPEELWNAVAGLMSETVKDQKIPVAAIGVTSMAEAGLLLRKGDGKLQSYIIPWFDQRTSEYARKVGNKTDLFERFCKSGLHNSYKYGLYKLMWLRDQNKAWQKDTLWLSVADYIAYKLTGEIYTDYSLAARTYAFDIHKKEWDWKWIEDNGFEVDIFPKVGPSGTVIAKVQAQELQQYDVLANTTVAVSGHDHVCAALAVGATEPGIVFDSMGTAETLMETMENRVLSYDDYQTGFSYGCHVVKDKFFWMGGISASGASVEWFRTCFYDPRPDYQTVDRWLDRALQGPTGIIYFPYLSGSGAPAPDPDMRAALIGLQSSHSRSDIVKAMLEGTSYEMEWIRGTAEKVTGAKIDKMIAVGGGTRNKYWMQIKADVSGCCFQVLPIAEATLLGAAWVAGIGCGMYSDEKELKQYLSRDKIDTYVPNLKNHHEYKQLYEKIYLALQKPLRQSVEYMIRRENL